MWAGVPEWAEAARQRSRTGRCVSATLDIRPPRQCRSNAEVAIDQVGRGPVVLIAPGCCRATVSMAGADQPRLAHEAGDPLATVLLSLPTQISMDARRPVGPPRTGMHGLDALQQGRVGRGVGRRWPLQPDIATALDTPSTRAIAVIGKEAWFALMNRKSSTAACRSPLQTRPRLLKEYRAPAATACSHAAAGSTHHARTRSAQQAPPPGGPRFCQPARPTREWSGRSAQTRGQDRRDYVQHGRDRPFAGETPANMVDVFLASATPLAKASGVHQTGATSLQPHDAGNHPLSCQADAV